MFVDDQSGSTLPGLPTPGEIVDGKYRLVRVLGTGGMGVVFEAEHLRLKQRCAIKMLSPEMLRESDVVHRFEREARASALLKSPHVTRVTDVATTAQGVPYIVMELLVGHDLDAELQKRGLIPCSEAVDYVLQACAAVDEAHAAGIIHRDLKPGNLFLAKEPEEGRISVKVLDFGISKMVEEESRLTGAGMTMGTALYMSPEQLRSAAKVDARADVWSLGIILYELVCGAPPFTGSAPQVAAAIVSDDAPDIRKRCPIPPALADAIHRSLKRAPSERFATVAEFAAALAPFAPEGSTGQTVAAQISRRQSSRSLPTANEQVQTSIRRDTAVDVDARTLHDVSTSAPHEVDTTARHHSKTRRLLIAAIAIVLSLVALAGVLIFLVVRPSGGGTAAATSPVLEPSSTTTPSAPAASIATTAPSAVPSADPPPAAAGSQPSPVTKPAANTPVRPLSPPRSPPPLPATTTTPPPHPPAPKPPPVASSNPTFLN
jgi:serine/threonine-protein kinase